MTRPITQSERITILELRVASLVDEQKEMHKKLDELLALRYKGAGAFWLATTLFGTTIIGLATYVVSWIRHG